ncbi:hypothetical protein PILCRDRAFT_17052 [Piloderma croceum F 1598]|uniref:Uncharacterized protein n=1 Tax=Piloderma croceum (strain F 1598) TaxID=765440 RepID=A0A0C3EFL0_PILCF|nr:hypothetical protein PILCRDRAFT_17052 [Piloderma croceum F 1598]
MLTGSYISPPDHSKISTKTILFRITIDRPTTMASYNQVSSRSLALLPCSTPSWSSSLSRRGKGQVEGDSD